MEAFQLMLQKVFADIPVKDAVGEFLQQGRSPGVDGLNPPSTAAAGVIGTCRSPQQRFARPRRWCAGPRSRGRCWKQRGQLTAWSCAHGCGYGTSHH